MSTPGTGAETSWEPQRGDLVKVKSRGQLGTLMGCDWGMFQVRPVEGGIEWDVARDDVEKPTDQERISAGVRRANALSQERL
ncbi:hypothetical protein [Streptomyces sp. NPDC008265]|uniref:hypothetical protein n=1 Tax=Streptomyces sp. NPDC008265 TaxID=3364824 RepID=UPI0036ECCA7D